MNKMMKNIKNDIMTGNNLEASLSQFFNEMTSCYYSYAGVRLAMHYFAFYEAICDSELSPSKETSNMIEQVNLVIKQSVVHKKNIDCMEETIKKVDQIRDEIMNRMKALTALTDIFQIYEYLLNRIEYQFKNENIEVDEDEFAKEILRYIFATEDSLAINEKIKEIIGQLPVRLTKTKYFELISNSITAYQGADQSSLDTYMYMLRTGAMLYQTNGTEEYYPELMKKKEYLDRLSYKELTQADYQDACKILEEAVVCLEAETSIYYNLQEVVNEVYAILLCAPYAGFGTINMEAQEKAAFQVIGAVNKEFVKSSKKNLSAKQMEQFVMMEGVQEELSFEVDNMEGILYEVNNNHRELTESLMIDKILNGLLRTQDLLSSSIFIEFNDAKLDHIVNLDYIDLQKKKLIEEMQTLFESHDKTIARAIMANTLSKMPVFFKDHKEVMDYIRYALAGGSYSEKAACVEIIQKIITE